ncbi:MAG: hypothetical protein K2Y39_14110 [Candidatus Obscuribacterales bacterium]|nr:hypothetical protein [Candidatus Obscuribacterales bacterium]
MSSGVDYAYAYPFESRLREVSGGRHLALATCGGTEKNPYFFQGRLVHARRSADLLLTCSEISRTRFYSPNEIRRFVFGADPVVTSGGERLRFEAFSLCCGVYARVDLRPNAIEGEFFGRGTTNVDFNAPMRAALVSISNSEKVGLNVGEEVVELERGSEKVVERKVKLPVRWLKGFVEVQAHQSNLKPAFEVSGEEARRFFSSLPKQKPREKGSVSYVVPAGAGMRMTPRETAQAVCVGAPGRLKVLEQLLRYATKLRVYGGDNGVSGWELFLDDASFHLVLSPDASRGFSGEGQVLSQLAKERNSDELAKVRAALQWQACIDVKVLSGRLGFDQKGVDDALAALGARGLVGFDLADGAYFHRELPFNLELVEQLQPRLINARKLIEEKKVRITKQTQENVEAYVKGTDVEHRVVITPQKAQCTCDWKSKHADERGECKHILAVEILSDYENN